MLSFVLPHLKEKEMLALPGKKPEYASLNIFKAMSSSQLLLNLSKYKSEDQEIYFEDLYFSISQIPCFTDYACRHYCAV